MPGVALRVRPREAIRIGCNGCQQNFDGDVPTEPRIARAITSPMPPAPRGAAISYVPRRVPGASATGNGCDYGRWDNLNGLVIENAALATRLFRPIRRHNATSHYFIRG